MPASPLEALHAGLKPGGFAEADLHARDIRVRKHFTPRQIRDWFAPSEGKDTLLSRLAAELSLRERTALEAALTDSFAQGGREWSQGYDFLVLKSPGARPA
jgi:hypothetical protein